MHLSVGEVKNRTTLQLLSAVHLVAAQSWGVTTRRLLVLLHLLQTRVIGGPAGHPQAEAVITTALVLSQVNYRVFLLYIQRWFILDAYLHDITPLELTRSNALTPQRHIRLDSWDDSQAYHYTGFNIAQLRRIYACYGLQDILIQTQLPYIQVPTRQRNQRNVECNYNFDPEELFLFMHTKCRTGYNNKEMCINIFGGHQKKWSYGFPWMLKYLDNRYRDIIGHQGLLRYVEDFPYFHRAMEREMQRPKIHNDVHNNPIHSDGLLHNPIFMFGLVDGSHDACCVPFAGPAGDYEFAPRKEHYNITQRAFYSGYKHFHSVKVETIALPNGI